MARQRGRGLARFDDMQPIRHPGQCLLEVLDNAEMSQCQLAKCMGVSPRRVNEIVLGKRDITADTALRLAAALGGEPRRWMLWQVDYDLWQASLPPGERRKRSDIRGTRKGEDRWRAARAEVAEEFPELDWRRGLRRGRW